MSREEEISFFQNKKSSSRGQKTEKKNLKVSGKKGQALRSVDRRKGNVCSLKGARNKKKYLFPTFQCCLYVCVSCCCMFA